MNNSIKKIYFLGPKGTYSEAALQKFIVKTGINAVLEPVSTIAKIIELIDNNKNTAALLPIENSIEGMVRATLDGIFECKNNPQILAQIQMPIENCLISFYKKEEIECIISHPQPLAQCRNYIAKNFDKNIILEGATSTAFATESLLKKSGVKKASIGNEHSANALGIPILEKNINDNKDNVTRFVFVSQTNLDFGKKTRTSIVFSTKQKPGALVDALNVFKKHDLNLIYIESRPSKRSLGEYNFFCDIEENLEGITPALGELDSVTKYYKILGSCPVI